MRASPDLVDFLGIGGTYLAAPREKRERGWIVSVGGDDHGTTYMRVGGDDGALRP